MFNNKTVFVGELKSLECRFSANPMPQARITVDGEDMTSDVTRISNNTYDWKVVYTNTSRWKLEDAGTYSCMVFYGNSSVSVSATATVGSKNIKFWIICFTTYLSVDGFSDHLQSSLLS